MKSVDSRALIFGITGQDGVYLAAHLLERGFEVHGTTRDKATSSSSGLRRLGIQEKITMHSALLRDFRSVLVALEDVRPRYIYNLAAQSSVGLSFEQPVETIDSIMHGSINIMEAMRFLKLNARLYNACSSECFGDTGETPADEATPFKPRSPYAVAKAASFWATANYREAYELYVCSGILFNHESPLRPDRYVTQKIVRGAVDIAQGKADTLELGRLDICRDWGWAPEYVVAMSLMLERSEPADLVIATGQSCSLKDFIVAAFAAVDLNWKNHVVSKKELFRPADILVSRGNPARARDALGWTAKVHMQELVERLVRAEWDRRLSLG